MIPATKPYLPNREAYNQLIDGIWERNWVTNHGPLVQELELRIAQHLDIEHLSFVSSGTTGLQLMLKSLPSGGEIITTPFSYVATTSAISWQGFTPVFADVIPGRLTIDPAKIREKINSQTRAILATHIYGNACEIEALDAIGKEFNIPVLYDGAHCFGSKYKERSLLTYGDMAVLSTHATKLYHTANGGFVVSKTADQKRKIDLLRNFGHNGTNNFEGIGINGKNSEFHAAMGLAILKDADALLERRKKQSAYYFERLFDSGFELIDIKNVGETNESYFPIICSSKEKSEELIAHCFKKEIELRRYFSPSLNKLDYVSYSACPVAEDISERIICLPLYHSLRQEDQDEILTEILKIHG